MASRASMTIVALDDPYRVGVVGGGGLVPVAAPACGGLATGYCLAGFQPGTPAAVSVTEPYAGAEVDAAQKWVGIDVPGRQRPDWPPGASKQVRFTATESVFA